MVHGYISPDTQFNLKISDCKLRKTTESEFLGVTVDDRLKFDTHKSKVLKKLSRVSGILWRSRGFLPRLIQKTIYLSLA